ncbi:hypothetical protein [Mycobacterium sp.]|uniref:hypothetical protein n=1 Tax=Mycobacterium sp. TaxID=1785 RepID=UPI002F42D6EF
MALLVTTIRPNSTSQLGTVATLVGAASASAALADNVDTSYIQFASRCRLDSQVVRVGFPTPTIPAGAKVYSVTLRRRILSVVAGADIPVCHHWFRSRTGIIQVAGQSLEIDKTPFDSDCPTSPSAATWVEENLGTFTTGPGGQVWDPTTNLNGFTYDMGRGDDSTTSLLKVSAVYLDVTYQQASSVTVTAPTGTVTTTRPTVTWTYSSPDSQPQQASQTAIYTAAQVAAVGFTPFVTAPLQQSGVVLGEGLQWTLTSDITDGGYSAYVQATSRWAGSGDFNTVPASTSWTRAASAATPPTAAVLSSAVFDSANNRVAVTFTPGGSSPATTAFTVQASRDGGVTWLLPDGSPSIPSLTLLPANGLLPVTGWDYVAPINVTSQYRVIAYGQSPLVAATSPSNVLSVTPTGNQFWLKHPTNPLLNTVLPVSAPKTSDAGIKVVKRRMQGTFQPLGGAGSTTLPFIVDGPNYGDEYSLELIFIDGDSNYPMTLWSAVDQLDRTGVTLLLQKPDGGQLWVSTGPGASGQDTEEDYNARPGDPTTVQWRRRKLVMTQTLTPSFF